MEGQAISSVLDGSSLLAPDPFADRDRRRKRRRSPTRVVATVSSISHFITLIAVATAISALETSLACSVIAVVAFLACVARILIGALRFSRREVDLCWLTFQAGLLFWFCFPGFTRAIQDNWYREAALVQTTPNSFAWAWVGVTIFAAAFDVTYAMIRPGQHTREFFAGVLGNTVPFHARKLVPTLVVVALSVFAAYVLLSGGISPLLQHLVALRADINKPWGSEGNYSTRLSTFSSIIEAFMIGVSVVSGDLALNHRVQGRSRSAAFALWLGCSAFLVLSTGGTRSVLALSVCAPLSLYIRMRLSATLGTRRLIGLLLIGIMILWFSSYLRASRSSGLGENQSVSFVYHEDVDFVAATALSYEIFRLSGEQTVNESALWMIAVNPVPRWIWRGKPDSKIIVSYSWFDWGIDVSVIGGNSLPSVVGQSLLSWGWAGILLTGLGWGCMAALGDSAIRDVWSGWALVTWSQVAWWMFTAFRFVGPAFFTAAYLMLLLINMRRLLNLFTRIHQSLGPALRPRN